MESTAVKVAPMDSLDSYARRNVHQSATKNVTKYREIVLVKATFPLILHFGTTYKEYKYLKRVLFHTA